jgi:hypothetical protein
MAIPKVVVYPDRVSREQIRECFCLGDFGR